MNAAAPESWRLRWARWTATPAREAAVVAAFFFLLTLGVFGQVLFGPGDVVLSDADADLARQFVHWRAFGFEQMRAGHLPLWNPHIYGGTQYFGGFQAALLYPPNWLYLCLPLARAINAGIALHVFLAGLFMYGWVRCRGPHALSAVLAGVLFMFSGPYFLHIYAGHLPNLCTMVWGPLILLAIDGWFAGLAAGWLLLGAAAVALQILAGHPQYVFYTGIAVGLYCLPALARSPRRWRALAGLGALVAAAVALSAVQLFEGFHAAGESVRSKGTEIAFAAVFSLPPENFVTFAVPGFFGDMTNAPYWGRCYLWEMSTFFGLSGLVLALYALVRARTAETWVCAGLAAIFLVLALGWHTPLFKPLYSYAPGFNKFRGWSKFTYPATLFLVMLAAVGADSLLRRGPPPRALVAAVLAGAALLLAGGLWAGWSARGAGTVTPQPWGRWIYKILYTGERLATEMPVDNPEAARSAARFAGRGLDVAAGTLLALGLVLLAARRRPWFVRALPAVALAEMLFFALSSLTTFPFEDPRRSAVAEYLAARPPGDYRVLNIDDANLGMSTGANDLWGYDPGVLRRYAELLAATQGLPANEADQELRFKRPVDIYASLLRCRYIFGAAVTGSGADGAGPEIKARAYDDAKVSPHVMIVPQTRLLPARDDIIQAMYPPFDPRQTVILETPPDPPPAEHPGAGKAAVVAETTDSLTIEADLPDAAVLVVTDAYSDGWRARSLLAPGEGSGQTRYHVMPADYCLRAIPLGKGHHRLLLEYRPAAFVVGAWVSGVSLALCLGAAGWLYAARRRAAASPG